MVGGEGGGGGGGGQSMLFTILLTLEYFQWFHPSSGP